MEKPNSPFEDMMEDVDSSLSTWLSAENLARCTTRIVKGGFEVTASIDGKKDPNREVSLVTINAEFVYPQHRHNNSDAVLIVTDGEAVFLSGETKQPVRVGDRIEIPRGMAHGFTLEPGKSLSFVSVQSPPIRNSATGEEDLELIDLV